MLAPDKVQVPLPVLVMEPPVPLMTPEKRVDVSSKPTRSNRAPRLIWPLPEALLTEPSCIPETVKAEMSRVLVGPTRMMAVDGPPLAMLAKASVPLPVTVKVCWVLEWLVMPVAVNVKVELTPKL